MYICDDCKVLFEVPEQKAVAQVENFGTRFSINMPICPYCGSDMIDKAHQCKECGAYDLSLSGGLCATCEMVLYRELDRLKENLKESLTPAQLEYIDDEWGGCIEL